MNCVKSAIKSTVSISDFNKGLAGKIFKSVNQDGAKVVMKNNKAECVLLSPKEYVELMDKIEDLEDYIMTLERESQTSEKTYTLEEVEKKFGITKDDLDNVSEEDLVIE